MKSVFWMSLPLLFVDMTGFTCKYVVWPVLVRTCQ